MRNRYKYLLIILLLASALDAVAQSDFVHYIPPFYAAGEAGEQTIVLSTIETTPFDVSVYRGRELIDVKRISYDAPQQIVLGRAYSSEAAPSTGIINDASLLNKVLTKQSFRLEAHQRFFCAVYHKTGVQGDILTCKGQSALGTEFFSGHMVSGNYRTDLISQFVAVMAAFDSTVITFYNPRVRYKGQTSNTVTVLLNKDESYILGADRAAGAAYDLNDFNGTKITSSKPIVVNTGNWLGISDPAKAAQDIGIDQIVPIDFTDRSYVVVKGNGAYLKKVKGVMVDENKAAEQVIVVSTSDKENDIYINGNKVTTLKAAGEYYIITEDYYSETSENMSIHADEKIYVYQTLAGDDHAATIGLCFLPPASEYSSNRDIFISKADYFSTNLSNVNNGSYPIVNIITKKNAKVNINGKLIPKSAFSTVLGNSEWCTYRITDKTVLDDYDAKLASFHITSDSAINASLLFGAHKTKRFNFGGSGFFSGFENPIYAIAKDTLIDANDLSSLTFDDVQRLDNGSWVERGGIIDSFSIDYSALDCSLGPRQTILFKAWYMGRYGVDTISVFVDDLFCNQPPVTPDYYYETLNVGYIQDNLMKGVTHNGSSALLLDTEPLLLPKYGTVSIDSSGHFYYIPDSSAVILRKDTFAYGVCDIYGECSQGLVYISADSVAQVEVSQISSSCTDNTEISYGYISKNSSPDKYTVWYEDFSIAEGFKDEIRQTIVGDEFTLPLPADPAPGLYEGMLYLEENVVRSQVMSIDVPILYPDSILVQKWNNVIAILNDSLNGGYTFSAYQWLENGDTILGATHPFLYLGADYKVDPLAEYSVLLTSATTLNTVSTCAITLHDRDLSETNTYPTVVELGELITVELGAEQGVVEITDIQGHLYASVRAHQKKILLRAPSRKGIYIIQIFSDNSILGVNKIIVK